MAGNFSFEDWESPVNAIIFPVYEFTLEHLTESGIGGPTILASSM